jgi:hypothetical protein
MVSGDHLDGDPGLAGFEDCFAGFGAGRVDDPDQGQ